MEELLKSTGIIGHEYKPAEEVFCAKKCFALFFLSVNIEEEGHLGLVVQKLVWLILG